MARPVSPTLTEAELRLMKVLWRNGTSTAGGVVATLTADGVDLAESSVRTILGILRGKRYVSVDRRGRSHHYRPLITEAQARQRALRYVLSRFFNDSREELVLSLIRDEATTGGELARIRRIIQDDS